MKRDLEVLPEATTPVDHIMHPETMTDLLDSPLKPERHSHLPIHHQKEEAPSTPVGHQMHPTHD